MSIRLTADSSANLFTMQDVSFACVPMKIITTEAEFVDNPSLDVADMVARIKATKGKSGTSCPNIQDWLDAFEGATEIFAVTITSNLSGSYASCVQAAEEYQAAHPDAKVTVIDSLSAGPELGLILEKLRLWTQEGRDYDRIAQDIQNYQKHTHLSFSLESLTNLARNGRVSTAVAKIAGVLGIRVVGVASDEGTLEPLHKIRGERKAMEALYQDMKNRGYAGGAVRIANCYNEPAAKLLETLIRLEYPKVTVEHERCTGLCSFYAERGGLLVGYEDKNA
ncbi:MAG: DegV family EDD domain-containing protein [Ruminococcaceae bacterium]|nr:DegV family EDD domain-containing protein [Oscillospiraceae bacterium]MBQ3216076.1 DegV family protein [Oscillospiraceae bacterium]